MSGDVEFAVTRLTEPHTVTQDGKLVHWGPLLDWLEESVTTVVGRAGSGGGGGGGVPLNEDAMLLLARFESRVKLMCEALLVSPEGDLKTVVVRAWRAAVDAFGRGELGDAQWESISAEFPDWVQRIEAEDDRPRKMEITTPCPRCGERWVYDQDSRKPAVVIEYSDGRAPVAECRHADCGAMWAGWADMAKLGLSLNASMDHAVLRACGITFFE